MNTIQAKNVRFLMDEKTGLARFEGVDKAMQCLETPLWYLQLECEGEEMAISSADQQARIEEIAPDQMDICYDVIKDMYDRQYAIGLRVHVKAEEELVVFTADLENQSENAVILQFTCPVLHAASLLGPQAEDTLYLPAELGMRIENPYYLVRRTLNVLNPYFWKYIRGHRLYHLSYPGCSMAWMGVETQGHFLYMAQHDEKARNFEMLAGPMGAGYGQGLVMELVHNPVLKPGKQGTMAPCCVGLLEGDWHSGAKVYGNFVREKLIAGWQQMEWMGQLKGLYRVTMKNGYERFHDYQDLPGIWAECKALGFDGLMLSGWWDEAIRPEDPKAFLSDVSKQKLQQAIAAVQSEGGKVLLVCHDLFPEKYGALAENIACKDAQGREFLPEYRYQPLGSHQTGHKAMLTACPGAEKWQQALAEVADVLQDCGADAVIYQSLGAAMGQNCTAEGHDHGENPEMWHAGEEKLFTGMKGALPAGAALPYDAAAAYAQCLLYEDYVSPAHTGSFPQLFLSTFPEIPVLVHLEGREEQDIQRDLLFSFLMGLKLDLQLTGKYREHLPLAGDLMQLKEKFPAMAKGHLCMKNPPALPDQVYWAEYACCCNKRIRILWNAGKEEKETMDCCLQPNDLAFFDWNEADGKWEKALQTGLKEGRIRA